MSEVLLIQGVSRTYALWVDMRSRSNCKSTVNSKYFLKSTVKLLHFFDALSQGSSKFLAIKLARA